MTYFLTRPRGPVVGTMAECPRGSVGTYAAYRVGNWTTWWSTPVGRSNALLGCCAMANSIRWSQKEGHGPPRFGSSTRINRRHHGSGVTPRPRRADRLKAFQSTGSGIGFVEPKMEAAGIEPASAAAPAERLQA